MTENNRTLQGKRILLTGAASGIGAGAARELAAQGAAVYLGDLNIRAGEALVEEIRAAGGEAFFRPLDVADSGQVREFVAHCVETLGAPDVAINNAGIDHLPTPLAELSDEVFQRNIQVNLSGVFYCMREEVRAMLGHGGGHIINVSSVAGLRSAPGISAYAAAKHGVMGLTRSAAVEYARAGIRVNAICPSFVRTPMVEGVLAQLGEQKAKGIVEANPMKRLGTVEEVVSAIVWLCSDGSSFMTGQPVILDGGMLA